MRMNRKGFTLVEIMIVVAIIALLAIIAIPNLLRAKISANDALAKTTLRTLSTASETYATANNGKYPEAITDLTEVTPPYINRPYIGETVAGFTYSATTWGPGTYTFTATPVSETSGSATFSISTGAIPDDW